jgi:site-specific DNA recombinase
MSKHTYGCASNVNGGNHACDNNIRVPRSVVERKLLAGVRDDLLKPEMVDHFRKTVSRLLKDQRKQDNRQALQKKHTKLDGEIEQMVAAIADGLYSPALKAKLTEAEEEKATIEAQLQTVKELPSVSEILPRAVDRYRELAEDLPSLTQRDIVPARQHLQELFGEIRLNPRKGQLVAEIEGRYGFLNDIVAGGQALPATIRSGSGGWI